MYCIKMKTYNTYLFDLDDTLLNFKESEQLSFKRTIDHFDIDTPLDKLFAYYQVENAKLWDNFDKGLVSKDRLKVERFEKVLDHFSIQINPNEMSEFYLNSLPDSVVLLDGTLEVLNKLSKVAEIGIITNGVEHIQHRRIEKSGIGEFVSFVCVSEACGFAKPDSRFFEYTVRQAKDYIKEQTIIIGDRYEADIMGGYRFGIDTCWFNPLNKQVNEPVHTYEISSLRDLSI